MCRSTVDNVLFFLPTARSRNKKQRKPGEDVKETVCPVCSERLVGSPEELNSHVELCLKQVGRCHGNLPLLIEMIN